MFVEFMGREVQIGYEPCGCKPARAEREEAERRAEAEERARWSAKVERAGVPARYARVDEERGEKWRAAADVYAGRVLHGSNVIACGPVGTGKTSFACYVALAALRAGRSVRFATSTEMLQDVRASYDAGWSERSITSKYIKPDLLVLDDLGQERATEWALETMFHIVNERYNAKLPAVVTMQRRPSEVMSHFAECDKVKATALMERLVEGAAIIDFNGRSHRVKNHDA